MAKKQDLYALLGVTQGASNTELEAAYQNACAALTAGADVHLPDVQNRLKFLRFAQETLLHKGKRAAYDASLIKVDTPAPPAAPAAPNLPLIALVLGIVGAACVAVAVAWFTRSAPSQPPAQATIDGARANVLAASSPTPARTPVPDSAAAPNLTTVGLFERYSQSVVVIEGLNGASKQILQGSGVVVADERVITNCHVAKSAASTVVKLADKSYPATLLRIDADPEHDLCLLSVSGLHAPTFTLASIGSVKVGQRVFALGAPKGLELTLSEGIVSSLRKYEDSHFIQTTASISPGSSGGALFNEAGALIGVTTFHIGEGQNLNFAVPVDWIKKLLEQTESLPVLGADSMNDLLGSWRCESTKGNESMLYRFNSNGSFDYNRPKSPDSAFAGTYAIAGNHTLVLRSPMADPPEVYIQILALSRAEMRISSPFYQDAQTYQCRKN